MGSAEVAEKVPRPGHCLTLLQRSASWVPQHEEWLNRITAPQWTCIANYSWFYVLSLPPLFCTASTGFIFLSGIKNKLNHLECFSNTDDSPSVSFESWIHRGSSCSGFCCLLFIVEGHLRGVYKATLVYKSTTSVLLQTLFCFFWS